MKKITVTLSEEPEDYFSKVAYELDTKDGRLATHSEIINHCLKELSIFEGEFGMSVSDFIASLLQYSEKEPVLPEITKDPDIGKKVNKFLKDHPELNKYASWINGYNTCEDWYRDQIKATPQVSEPKAQRKDFDENYKGDDDFVRLYDDSEPVKEEQEKWKSIKNNPPIIGIEVIGYNKKWIDEDFNPNGTRQCVLDDMGWMIARWNASNDCWTTDYTSDDDCKSEPPTHWISIPNSPLKSK
jgi:hypothetical protein